MSDNIRIIWAIIGLLIGAGLLTYLTQGSAPSLSYEFDRKKKRKKKKSGMKTQYPVSVRDYNPEASAIDAPSSFEETDTEQKPHSY
jgi:hypothetical protein